MRSVSANINSQLPSQMYASARKPSCFKSNRKSGSSNGVRTRLSWAVSNRGGRIKDFDAYAGDLASKIKS
jgi:hypothetical protein